jgi:hypothetical protein
MITAHNARSTRRRGSNKLGKNDPAGLGDRQRHVAGGRGQHARPVTVALVRPGGGAFVQASADPGGQLVFNQLLQRTGEQVAEQTAGGVVDQAGGNRGQRCIIVLGIAWHLLYASS